MSLDLVNTFYTSFAAQDGEAMAACYHDDIIFEDPAFGELKGPDAGDMWRMLCANAKDLRVEHTVNESTDQGAKTNWIAHYTFSATGRPVRNDINATMKFRDGKIIDHRDEFSMWKWSSQALGMTGKLLGWSPPLQAKVSKMARAGLADFQAAQD